MKFVELLRYRHYKVRSIALNITSFGFNVNHKVEFQYSSSGQMTQPNN